MYEGKMIEVELCFTYSNSPEGVCCGASGRKFRQVCVYCPMMQRYYNQQQTTNKGAKDNVEKNQ